MRRLLLGAAAPFALAALPAGAQEVDHSTHQTPAKAAEAEPQDHSAHGDAAQEQEDHSAHGDAASSAAQDHSDHMMDHGGHHMAPARPADPDQEEPGNAPSPPVPADHAADAVFGAAAMRGSRADLASMGRWRGSALIVNRLEVVPDSPETGYAWDLTAWTGGDIDRLVIASEGEGHFGGMVESAEVAAKWRHALDPYANLELGLRRDFRPEPSRTYALAGIEALLPYWIHAEAQLLLSNKGDLHARLGAEHDWRLAGPLVLNLEAETDIAFQDVRELGIQAGIEKIEAGARLRYEIRPEFAPYVGVSWERAYGSAIPGSAEPGDRGRGFAAVVGIRAFF
ncbi:copper resistance protein B [Novosphingobium kunmingense]|uniref:Copper resistance protein B n=1 Tax=Novosphingobium kunmingense TaxID=1211806 RepID=A0A2N0HJC3_9SPHN|nr:copper resistance protein B [Novosphingobium kunmingense]PKB19042.1 copper resistance protein B [Novosphingobium kunmingense]